MSKKIAGVYFHSGKTSQFIACVLDYFEPGDRWVLDQIYFSGDSSKALNESFESWVIANNITDLVLNFPVSPTLCESCTLMCPGEDSCHHSVNVEMKETVASVLEKDSVYEKENPKDYERARNKQDEYVHRLKVFSSNQTTYTPISKSLKKRLRRGFIPYWNRPIDLFICLNYYNELIQVFNYSYDSFGHTSLMNIKRFNYLSKHLTGVNIWESNIYLNFLELLRSEILATDDLYGMKYVDEFSVSLRKNIVSKVEKNLNIFIKSEDSAILTFDPRAINALVLSLSGVAKSSNHAVTLPSWCQSSHQNFIVPTYSLH
jgi:hypothetical protein